MTQATAGAGLFRLHRSGGGRGIQPTAEQLAVIDNTARRLKVLAGPGTGKSATLVESVAERILRAPCRAGIRFGADVFTPGSGGAHVQDHPQARHHHPGADRPHPAQLCLLAAPRAGRALGSSPTAIARAGESDQMVRELLAGQRESGRGNWPPAVSAALSSPAFAAELRELMLRTAERGITPRPGSPNSAAAATARNGRPLRSLPGSTRTSPISARAAAGWE